MKKHYRAQNTFWYIIATFIFVAFLVLYIPSVKGDGQAYFKKGFKVTEVYVAPNNTIWTLHNRYGGNSDKRNWVQAVEELNGRDSAMIYQGETIKVWEMVK